MTVRYERPVSRAAYRAQGLAALAFVIALSAWGLHRFGPLETPYFLALMAVAAALGILAVYLALIGLAMLWKNGARGGKAAIKALVLVIVPLAPPAVALVRYVTLPALYDVTSDLADPPRWLAEIHAPQMFLGERLAAGTAERKAQGLAYRGVTGRRYDGALDRVYTAARKVAEDNSIAITREYGAPELAATQDAEAKPSADETVPDALDNIPIPMPRPEDTELDPDALPAGDAYIQGERRTLIFGLRQDVVIRLREEAETTLVDIRVSARYGHHDFGEGVRYIEAYLRALDAELLGIAGD